MSTTSSHDRLWVKPGVAVSRSGRLEEIIDHAAHMLPAQGPITVFIHHNTLHAFEDLPFDPAVQKGARLFGCQPYRTEDRFREDLRRGRIRFSELQEVLEHDLGPEASDPVPAIGTRLDLRLAMLQYPMLHGPTEELIWYVTEADALRKTRPEVSSAVADRMVAETRRWVIRDLRKSPNSAKPGSNDPAVKKGKDGVLRTLLSRFGESTMESWTDEQWESFTLQALWRVCCEGVSETPQFVEPPRAAIRHRDLLFEVTGADSDAKVHEILIRFVAAYLDQGMAQWNLPRRDEGFFPAFCSLYRGHRGPPDRWLRGFAREMARLQDEKIAPIDSILESLEILGVPESEWPEFLEATLLALRGWAGMLRQIELRGDRAVHPIAEGSLIGFLAIRLILDRYALRATALDALDHDGPLSGLRESLRSRVVSGWPPSVEQRAFSIFQIAQLFGLTPETLNALGTEEWTRLIREVETFHGIERRRIFHRAYEKRFTTRTLDAVAQRAGRKVGRVVSPRFQVVCCIDEREESFRRNLEEVVPEVETFGVAGFFSVAMYYRGVADAHFVPLCPPVVRPNHWIVEEVNGQGTTLQRLKARTRRFLGTASHQFHIGTRSFALGALLTGLVGALASFPLVARILFPRLAGQIRQSFGKMVRNSPRTHLKLERSGQDAGTDGRLLGFSIDEMVEVGERLLREMGLTRIFARLIVLLGHGSHSQNNPHSSAYHCGACGGSNGGPNARAMAQILSNPEVREELLRRGLAIPADSIFVGGSHNTCDDSVLFFDVDRIPETHRQDFNAAKQALEETCERNAHERCRRFMSAPLGLSFEEAHEHVKQRSEDLAEARPELGHATNAITFVGRREWTRGLFLDRRAFLTSYDPSEDDADGTILTRVLSAVFPVCAGINLEYYFSLVDNVGFGCGTKLPHNIASLLGVMDGASSDLRTGLPHQMVEIHEPVRVLFLVETSTETMARILERNQSIGQLCRNGWVQLAVLHPTDRTLSLYAEGQFRPYLSQSSTLSRATSSADWYGGWRDHLEFAEIDEPAR